MAQQQLGNIDRIFLDVDGVLADWVGGVCRLFKLDAQALYDAWGDEWGIENELAKLGYSKRDMWQRIDEMGASFWGGLHAFPWALDLHTLCKQTAPTTILTTPSLHHSCAAGKVQWLNRHLAGGGHFRDFLIGPNKEACARPGAVLIDDKPYNCEKFIEAGGAAILFPRPWNEHRDMMGGELEFVQSVLIDLNESRASA